MYFRWRRFSLVVFVTCLKVWMSMQYDDELFYEKFINYLYEIYPDFEQKLFEFNGTDFGVNSSVKFKHISKGYAMQAKTEGGYSVFLSSTKRKSLLDEGETKMSERPHSVLYKCKSAIHYCSGNPAYCFYREGDPDSKLIITSPHAGPLNPASIPERGAGCWDPLNEVCIYKHNCEDERQGIAKSPKHCEAFEKDDEGVTDIAEVIVKAITRLTGSRPHFIVNRLHRARLDVNRDIKLGAFGEEEAEQAWNDFHEYIKQAKRSFNGGWGLLLDLHGNNRGNWTMLGYGMYKYQMKNKPLKDDQPSSLKTLQKTSGVPLEDLIRGKNSLGHFLEEAKCRVFPSPENPSPMNKGYLTGGYITRNHGSRHGGNIDAIQIEIPNSVRDSSEEDQTPYIAKLTQAIVKFVNVNYYQKGKVAADA